MRVTSIFSVILCGLTVGAVGNELYRLALFEPTDTPDARCGLDLIGEVARFFTVFPTTVCTLLPDSEAAFKAEPKYFKWTNETGKECFKAGCDSRCHTCEVEQGSCNGGSGGGSGSGTTTRPRVVENDVEVIMSDELVTCGTSTSGDTRYPGLSFMGNPTPDRLHTLLIEHPTIVHIDGCGADFETSIKIFSTDEEDGTEPILNCRGCEDCFGQVEAGEYALLVEGDETKARKAGVFNLNVDCGSTHRPRAERIDVVNDDDSTPMQLDTCYSRFDENAFHSFFVFKMDTTDKTQQACIIEQAGDRSQNNSIKLEWVGATATCDARSDDGSTIVASVIRDDGNCARGNDGSYSEVLKLPGQNYSIEFECDSDACTTCHIVENNVLPGSCFHSNFEIMKAHDFSTCNINPGISTGTPATTPKPNPQPLEGKKKSSPVGAIVGAVFGALVVAGIVFFVIRKRKQMNSSAYTSLNDDLSTTQYAHPFSSD